MNKTYLEDWEICSASREVMINFFHQDTLEFETVTGGVKIVSERFIIDVTYRYGEYGFGIFNVNSKKYFNLNDLILEVFPDYYRNKDIKVFSDENQFANQTLYFKHLVQASLEFLAKYYPQMIT
ncbi:MAG TPA: hypothetical protein VF691_12240 [Cytophagaceae bacterium]|jgi:hypothetical protein